MSELIRALIVDDERRARRDLRSLLEQHGEIDIVGEADNVTTAASMIALLKPDVVFLDIQMPGDSGFKLFDLIKVDFQVVFITAFDNYAIRAFEVNALDYLLKPVNPARLATTIARLKKVHDKPATTLEQNEMKLNIDDYVFIKEKERASFIKVASIVLIKAQRDYSEISTDNRETRLALKSLVEWEAALPPQFFIRVHRSLLINIQFVDKLEDWFNNAYRVQLRTIAEPIITSRRYAAKLREKFT